MKSQKFKEILKADSPLYVSGNYAIIKNESRYIKTDEDVYYFVIDMSEDECELSTLQWPDYYYVFDEEYYGDNLKIPNDKTKEAVRWYVFHAYKRAYL